MKFHSTVELGGKTDLALALSLDHAAPEFFETLSHSHRRAYVDWISR